MKTRSDEYSGLEEFVRRIPKVQSILLVAEDDEPFRFILKTAFEQSGCIVLEARDGEEAVRVFDSSPELKGVTLDFRLPKLNGIEVFRHIRKKTKTLPVMFITGYVDAPEMQEIPSIGMSMIAQKPMSVEEIEAFVQAITE